MLPQVTLEMHGVYTPKGKRNRTKPCALFDQLISHRGRVNEFDAVIPVYGTEQLL